ncbi:hypothetical protein JZO76_10920 [Enterococcus sp. MJM12]|uniref:Uncharacterized protein n=1 Tax=Candidatus Enterococcus myersii TaxID=2815322 RepID=A0ABS3H9A6_9ENTE|nr:MULTISPECIES: hypothetical protein [Enterococcus]MBO0450034.1 hypothetical protein [Enterococcus sp. MJM12]MCD1025761.1 hypothetical protein [Enterococcus sp. SMC-9]MDT2740763.1 hypothetical protein [Enterococcus canintestini]WHA08621.1 hypothetical protein P3T75_09880 [Enterococcus montenegrensis]
MGAKNAKGTVELKNKRKVKTRLSLFENQLIFKKHPKFSGEFADNKKLFALSMQKFFSKVAPLFFDCHNSRICHHLDAIFIPFN